MFPVSLCLMWDQIFSIGFKSGLRPGPKHEPDGLVLKPSFGGFCSVGRSIVLLASDCSSLENNFSIVGSKPFCNILLYSKALIDFSQWSSSPVPAAEKAPHTMTPLPPCLTVVEMHSLLYFSPDLRTHLSGASACNWNLDSSLHPTLLNHSESNFPYSAKNLILSLMFFWDSNGFLTHLLDTKPALDNLLVIVLLERVLFSEVLNSADSFWELYISAVGHTCTMRLWAFQILSFSQDYLLFQSDDLLS